MKKLFATIMLVVLLPLSFLANAGTWSSGVEDRASVRITNTMDFHTLAVSYGYTLNGAAAGTCPTVGATRKYYTTFFAFPQPGPVFRGVMRFYTQICM